MITKNMMKSGIVAIALATMVGISAGDLFARGWDREDRGGCFRAKPGCGNFLAKPFRHYDRMQYFLGLSDEQVEKIFKIDQEYREKYFKNRNTYDKIQELRAEHKKAMESVLTKEQKEKFNEFRENKPNRFHEDRGNHEK